MHYSASQKNTWDYFFSKIRCLVCIRLAKDVVWKQLMKNQGPGVGEQTQSRMHKAF